MSDAFHKRYLHHQALYKTNNITELTNATKIIGWKKNIEQVEQVEQVGKIISLKPKFYKRYVDGTITERKKNTDIDELFQNMNSHHPNFKLTVDTNPASILDIAFSKNLDSSVTTNAFRKLGKLPTFWNSQIPRRYKPNNIQGDLDRAFKVASDFDAEFQKITQKYLEVGYPIFTIFEVSDQ